MNLKMNFKYFQIQKWILQVGKAEKVDEKNAVIFLVFMFPFWVMTLKLSKKCTFSILCWPQKKNLSMLMQFMYMHLKRLITRFQKMLLFTMLWLNVLEICVWNRRALLHFCWFSIALIANISWSVAQTPINHIIFWNTVIKIFTSIYVNCFNRIRFLAEGSTKLQKMHFFGQFKDHNSRRKHGN